MRIAVVSETFLPHLNGVTTSVMHVLDHLRRRGHEAALFCPGPAPQEFAGFAVHALPAVDYRGFRAALPTWRIARLLLDWAPDVVHAAAPFGIGAQALSVARRHGIGSVAVFQTDLARYARDYGLSLTTAAAWRWIRTVHRRADLTLAPSGAAIADLKRVDVPNVHLWSRGVDTRTYHPNRRRTAQVHDLRRHLAPEGQVLIGYVGRLAPEKSVEHLAEVAAVPGARLVVVGDGPSRSDLTRVLAGTDAVILGARFGPGLADAYAALDVFVHTGMKETFGQTLQEAMAAGLPVVAPGVGGPLDIVAHGRSGFLVEPGRAGALRSAAERLVRDRAMRARMGEAGRRAVLDRSWETVGDALLGFYRQAGTAASPLSGRLSPGRIG